MSDVPFGFSPHDPDDKSGKPGDNPFDFSQLATGVWNRSADGGRTIVVAPDGSGDALPLLPLLKDEDHVLPYDCDPSYGIDINGRELSE